MELDEDGGLIVPEIFGKGFVLGRVIGNNRLELFFEINQRGQPFYFGNNTNF